MEQVWQGTVDLAWRRQYVGVEKITLEDGVPVFFIDNEYYFKREGLYGFFDDGERFAYFCRAVLAMLPHIGFGRISSTATTGIRGLWGCT